MPLRLFRRIEVIASEVFEAFETELESAVQQRMLVSNNRSVQAGLGAAEPASKVAVGAHGFPQLHRQLSSTHSVFDMQALHSLHTNSLRLAFSKGSDYSTLVQKRIMLGSVAWPLRRSMIRHMICQDELRGGVEPLCIPIHK